MSVINKMLKDLEQRHDDASLDEISPIYRAPEKNPIKYILIALSVVVIGLIATVSWLLLKDNENTLVVTSSEERANIPKQASKPKKVTPVKPQKTAAEEKELELEQALNDYEPEKPPQILDKPEPMVPVVVPAKPAKKVTEKPKVNAASKPKVSADVKPKEQPKLSIIKSSEQYSPQERLDQLMKKAQSSFDKGYVSEAVDKLNKVLSISDGHVMARNLLAVAWYGRGELQQAVSILNDGLSKYPNVELWRMTAAKIYFKENNMEGAFSYLDIDLSNGSLDFYSMKASVARKLENFQSAESAYLKLTELQPNVGNWWLGHAISLDSQGKFDEAIVSYQTVIDKGGISPASMDFVQGRIKELEI